MIYLLFFSLLFFIVAAESSVSGKKNTLGHEERISSFLPVSKKNDQNDVTKADLPTLKNLKTIVEKKHATNSHVRI